MKLWVGVRLLGVEGVRGEVWSGSSGLELCWWWWRREYGGWEQREHRQLVLKGSRGGAVVQHGI